MIQDSERATPAVKPIKLRYPGTCCVCSTPLAADTKAYWSKESRRVTCLECATNGVAGGPKPGSINTASRVVSYDCGTGGGSAEKTYRSRHLRREQKLDAKWGSLAGVVKFLADDPQSIRAWREGADGERRLAKHLAREVGDSAVILNDRKVPGTKGNIDHLVISSCGVWVIDAKNYQGRIQRRDVGGWFKVDERLYVRGRDRTKLAKNLGWQVDAVCKALGDEDVPIHPVLCFTNADWSLFAKPFRIEGVLVAWAAALAKMIKAPGALDRDTVERLAEVLGDRLQAAVPSLSE